MKNMDSIRLVGIPFEEKDELPQLISIAPHTYGRMPSSFLDEAIWFYNFPAVGKYYTSVSHWPIISFKNLNNAILALHDVYKDSIIRMVKKLYGTISSHLENRKIFHGYHSERGTLCAELLISPRYRNSEKVRLLARGNSGVHFREFEQLEQRVGLLRTWISLVENIYQERYSVKELGIRKTLFEPTWGGSWIVKPRRDIWKTGDRFWNPDKPIYPYDSHEVGPTEKLYFSLCSNVFKKLHNVSFLHSRGYFNRTKDVFLQRIHRQAETILQIMPPCQVQKIKTWRRHLEHLAYLFENALYIKKERNNPPQAWMEKKEEEWIDYYKVDDCGVRVGFPAALALIGILYAYIIDLMARTLMTALSSAIIDIYEDINGYTAMGLYEALSGMRSIAPYGKNSVIDEDLVGSLQSWRSLPKEPAGAFWGESETEKNVLAVFKELLDRPLIKQAEWKGKASYKKQKADIGNDISFDDFRNHYIPRYPVITKDFYRMLHIPVPERFLDNWFADERLYGARFSAQLRVYVAFQMLQKSRKVLHWDWDKKEYKTEENDEVLKKRRSLLHFFITAGSFVWGGRKPPHMTHREGINFDFIFGPDLISWPEAQKVEDDIFKFIKSKKGKEYLEKSQYKFLKWEPRTLVICYTKRQETSEKALWTSHPHVVFRRLLRNKVVNIMAGKAKELCKINKEGNASYYSKDEEMFYQEAEKVLTGTPHFIKPTDASSLHISSAETTELADWQRTHAGYLSILLSGPKLIIYASPIVYFRALHAIRRSLKDKGILFFSFNCTEGTIKYLNNTKSMEIPQELSYAFAENNIPLSDNHMIEVVEMDCIWVLTNYETRYMLNVSEEGDSINVRWLIPQELVNRFSDLLTHSGFGFLPHNHHNHWHVNYNSGIDEFKTLLQTFKEIWLLLSVDLKPFREYLSKYKINDDPLLKEVAKEKQDLLKLMDDYIQEFEDRYGNNKNPFPDQKQQTTISQKFMEEIFSAFKEGSPLIEPTIGEEHIRAAENTRLKFPVSKDLKDQIDISEKLLFEDLLPKLYKGEKIRALEWRVAFIKEQEPIKVIEKAIDIDEPELDDHEEITA